MTRANGEDVNEFMDSLFKILNTATSERVSVPAHFGEFGYVNGKLFDQRTSAPKFSSKARKIAIECGTLDWSQINPDIFGSMIQAVVHPSQRGGSGDALHVSREHHEGHSSLVPRCPYEAFDEPRTAFRKLERLLDRLSRIRYLRPRLWIGKLPGYRIQGTAAT